MNRNKYDYLPYVFSIVDTQVVQFLVQFENFVKSHKIEIYIRHVRNVRKEYSVRLYCKHCSPNSTDAVLEAEYTVSSFKDIAPFITFLNALYSSFKSEFMESIRFD